MKSDEESFHELWFDRITSKASGDGLGHCVRACPRSDDSLMGGELNSPIVSRLLYSNVRQWSVDSVVRFERRVDSTSLRNRAVSLPLSLSERGVPFNLYPYVPHSSHHMV